MENRSLPSPLQKNYEAANNLAYQLACQQLGKIEEIEGLCRRAGAEYRVAESTKLIAVRYLNRTCLVTLPDVEISLEDNPEAVSLREKILILHYLLTASGAPIANKPITFRELPEGSVYYPTFVKRTIQPIINSFGTEPRLLLEVGQKLGGEKADFGDLGITIKAFPFVPITFVMWRGDDEFPPQGNVLFDATISNYLPTEDVTVLCEAIAWKLVRLKKPVS